MTVMLVVLLTWVLAAVSLAVVLGRSIRLGDECESPLRYLSPSDVPQDLDGGIVPALIAGAR